MKISYQWLREFVDLEAHPRQLAEDLTNVGIAVETVEALDSDYILDLDLTTNRPDCLSHMGVAREVSVLYRNELKKVESHAVEAARPAAEAVSVSVTAPHLCSRYSARVITGVTVSPSPRWLVSRLEALGIRSVNNVADATNYVLMELGHPLHAFDLAKVDDRHIEVREARDREFLVTIDGENRTLSLGMLVIADRSRAVALAGIMGGLESEISSATREVLLESAWFDPINVRRTSKQLGMHTEASQRFERGADISATVPSLDRTAALIQQLGGGEILMGVVDVYPRPMKREPLFLRKSRLLQVMGIEIGPPIVEDILTRLELKVLAVTPEGWRIALPTFRLDVEREIDLIEEVARHYGYDKFTSTLPVWNGRGHRRPEYSRERVIKERLLHLGYSETFTYSFVDREETRKFSDEEPVPLQNPLSSEMGVMRTSLLPGMIGSLSHNYHRGIKNVRLYELGKVFRTRTNQPEEEVLLGVIATGSAHEKSVHLPQRPLSFFDLKGDLEVLLGSLSFPLSDLQVRPPADPEKTAYYHPGVVAEIAYEGRKLGIFGQLHPKVCEGYKIKQQVFVGELLLGSWYGLEIPGKGFSEIPKFPAIQRDLSIIVDQAIDYGRIEATIKAAGIREIQKIHPFDVYLGQDLPTGKKAVAFSVIYQVLDRTLVEDEVNRFQEILLERLTKELGAQLRS
jgi:phenylalanyl-tRNA synthetase beta chain